MRGAPSLSASSRAWRGGGRAQPFGELARLAGELRRLVLSPRDGHRASDPVHVADRAVLILELLVQPHVFVAGAETHAKEVVNSRNEQRLLYAIRSRQCTGGEVASGRVAAQHDLAREVPPHPVDAAAHLRDHLRQRDARQQPEVERHVGGARLHGGFGGKRVLSLRLALPGPAVDEDKRLALAVDVERLDRRGAVALGTGLAAPRANGIARDAEAPDDVVGVRNPSALLVLLVERLLVVVAENLFQSNLEQNRDAVELAFGIHEIHAFAGNPE